MLNQLMTGKIRVHKLDINTKLCDNKILINEENL